MRNTILRSLLLTLLAFASLPATATSMPSETAPAMAVEVASKLDLNSADAVSLQSGLVGIGKAKAQAIISYREEHGDFKSVDELLEVKGIGQALLDRNRDRLTIGN